MIRVPSHRVPTHPGEMLLEEFLIPMGLTQRKLANAIRVPHQQINGIVNGRRGMTLSTALRLAKYFGMSADFWMNLQLRWDLYHAQQSEKKELKAIRPFAAKIPNKTTKRALEDARKRRNLKSFDNTKNLFDDLVI
jgi:addiction module HigA family antidote